MDDYFDLLKALQCCRDNGEYDSDCSECPYSCTEKCGHVNELAKEAIEQLIKK